MTEALLYQSILQKLGQLPLKGLPQVDAFLAFLVSQEPKKAADAPPKKTIGHLFGAWKTWDEQEFQDFLAHTAEVRGNLFSTRDI
jgi:hypothetical protein